MAAPIDGLAALPNAIVSRPKLHTPRLGQPVYLIDALYSVQSLPQQKPQ
jgi:hypothetical protein